MGIPKGIKSRDSLKKYELWGRSQLKKQLLSWCLNVSRLHELNPIMIDCGGLPILLLCIHFLNGPTLASFSFIFSLFKQTLQFYNKYMWKNVHPLNCAGIRTHDLRIVSLFPLPLDQGSRPEGICFFVMSKKFYATYLLLSANLNLSLSSSLEFRFE